MVHRTGLSLAFVVVLALGTAVAAPPPLPPTGGVRIESLTHDATRTLNARDVITVTLRGSAGGTATFHIFGVVADVSMQQVQPGVYQAQPAVYVGKYTVRPGDNARNAALVAMLKVGGRDVVAASNRQITIDTTPPAIAFLSPAPQARLTNARPNIVVGFFDAISGVNPGSIRILVNGNDVSARASITETSASYTPDVPLPPGPVQVQVALADRVKNAQSAKWTFTIVPSTDLVKSVTINPTTALKSGDVLTVVVTGAPGGEASFGIVGLSGSVEMRESSTPGTYLGSYAVRLGPRIVQASVIVTLTKAGQRSEAFASVPVTILPMPPSAPADLRVDNGSVARIVLTGRSLPGFRVEGGIALGGRVLSPDEQIPLGEFMTLTAANGSWQTAIGPLIPSPGAKLIVSVVAVDPAGQRSPPTTMEITLR